MRRRKHGGPPADVRVKDALGESATTPAWRLRHFFLIKFELVNQKYPNLNSIFASLRLCNIRLDPCRTRNMLLCNFRGGNCCSFLLCARLCATKVIVARRMKKILGSCSRNWLHFPSERTVVPWIVTLWLILGWNAFLTSVLLSVGLLTDLVRGHLSPS